MDLVKDDVPKVSEQPDNVVVPVHQHTFKRFRGYLKYSLRVAQSLVLVGHCNVPVPVKHRDAAHVKKLVKPRKLVVDKAFQRSDIQRPEGLRRVIVQPGDYREKGSLCLPGRGGGGQKQVVFRAEKHLRRADLHLAETVPVAGVDVVPDEGGVFFKCGHGSSPFLFF